MKPAATQQQTLVKVSLKEPPSPVSAALDEVSVEVCTRRLSQGSQREESVGVAIRCNQVEPWPVIDLLCDTGQVTEPLRGLRFLRCEMGTLPFLTGSL